VISQWVSFIDLSPPPLGEGIQVHFRFRTIGVTPTLGKVAGEKHGGFALVGPEVGAEFYTGTASYAEVLFINIFQQFFRPEASHFRKTSTTKRYLMMKGYGEPCYRNSSVLR
jgi:hypothetical protein